MSSRKLAIVTGASSGIGLEIARLAAQDGYDLIVAADTPFVEAGPALKEFGVDVQQIEGDLATQQGLDQLLVGRERTTKSMSWWQTRATVLGMRSSTRARRNGSTSLTPTSPARCYWSSRSFSAWWSAARARCLSPGPSPAISRDRSRQFTTARRRSSTASRRL